ncbi:MAG: 1-aminocyclopropane-1-carboxylate deaminase/D-cysteine desulfhydrase [Actinomycetota bacterium]
MNTEIIKGIEQKIGKVPRVTLGSLPTPLQEMENMGLHSHGHKLFIKRDDIIGGNKVRKLEFFIAEALDKKAETVITFGAPQSNHTRETAVACRKVGLEPIIVISGKKRGEIQGNALLNRILGAEIIYTPPLSPPPFTAGGPQTVEELSDALKGMLPAGLAGPKSYIIPVGGYTPLGSMGYLLGFLELYGQLKQAKVIPHYVVTAAGTTGTYAGLLCGAALVNRTEGINIRVVGISVTGEMESEAAGIMDRVRETAAIIGEDVMVGMQDIDIVNDYWKPGYGIPNSRTIDAIKTLARKEGIFLDPVYTGKAMGGLLDLMGKEKFSPESNIIFMHTGGFPAIFAYAKYFL